MILTASSDGEQMNKALEYRYVKGTFRVTTGIALGYLLLVDIAIRKSSKFPGTSPSNTKVNKSKAKTNSALPIQLEFHSYLRSSDWKWPVLRGRKSFWKCFSCEVVVVIIPAHLQTDRLNQPSTGSLSPTLAKLGPMGLRFSLLTICHISH